MALDTISVTLDILTFIILIASFFFLLEVKSRTEGKLGTFFTYLTAALVVRIAIRIYEILNDANLLTISYFPEIAALAFSIILIVAVYTFYENLKGITDRPGRNRMGREKPMRRTVSQTHKKVSEKTLKFKDGYLDLSNR